MVKWIRSRGVKQAESAGKHCTGCRSTMLGATEDELRASGGILLAGVGWFCSARCEWQYRLRFRIQPDAVPLQQRTPVPRPPPLVVLPAEPDPEEKRSAVEELAEVLRRRRRRLTHG